MSDSNFKKSHGMSLENRELLQLTGVNDVSAFNEEEIFTNCDYGELIIKGQNLHIDVLDLESGILKINGKIDALVYSEVKATKGLFKRLLS